MCYVKMQTQFVPSKLICDSKTTGLRQKHFKYNVVIPQVTLFHNSLHGV